MAVGDKCFGGDIWPPLMALCHNVFHNLHDAHNCWLWCKICWYMYWLTLREKVFAPSHGLGSDGNKHDNVPLTPPSRPLWNEVFFYICSKCFYLTQKLIYFIDKGYSEPTSLKLTATPLFWIFFRRLVKFCRLRNILLVASKTLF